MRGKVHPVLFDAQRRSFEWMNNESRRQKRALYATGMSHKGQQITCDQFFVACHATDRWSIETGHILQGINVYIGLFVSPARANRRERTMMRSWWHSGRRCDARTAERGSYWRNHYEISRIKGDALCDTTQHTSFSSADWITAYLCGIQYYKAWRNLTDLVMSWIRLDQMPYQAVWCHSNATKKRG